MTAVFTISHNVPNARIKKATAKDMMIIRLSLYRKVMNDIKNYSIEITVVGNNVSFDFDPKIPCLLADQIKKVVEDYFKED